MPRYTKGQMVGVRLGERQTTIMNRVSEHQPQKKQAELLRESLECLAVQYGVQEGLPI